MLWCVTPSSKALSSTGFYLGAAAHSVEVSGYYQSNQQKKNAEINQNKTQKKKKNAVYKLKFCGFRLGAMTPSTGKLLYCNDNGGED